VDVDRAVEGLERVALQRIHDLVAREDAAGALRKHDEQVELVPGQVAELAVEAGDAGAEVDLEAAEAKHVVVGGLRRGAAQQRLDPGQQLARLEGLADVVVGAELEADDAIHGLAAGR
jgi:hypothetical protein